MRTISHATKSKIKILQNVSDPAKIINERYEFEEKLDYLMAFSEEFISSKVISHGFDYSKIKNYQILTVACLYGCF